MASEGIVIVGGGLAAGTAAQTLREEGYTGAIRVVCGEAHAPYQRPPLSKEYLNGSADLDSTDVVAEGWYAEHDVELLVGVYASTLDTAAHTVTLDDGRRLGYDTLLLATGATPRRLPVDGADADGVHYLRTIEDSTALREVLSDGNQRVVLVGTGWIGLEVAAAARGYGDVTAGIGLEEVPLGPVLGDELGRVFAALHEKNGVQLHMGSSVRSLDVANGHVVGVVTDRETLPADVVVVGIGATPNTALAEAAGIEVDHGILTDSALRTSAPDVYAAGDVASIAHTFLDGRHLRTEHWATAIDSGKAAALSMLGRDVAYDAVPYFFTDQYDLGMEYAGYGVLAAGADVVYRGDPASLEFVAFWVRDGAVVAGMNVNIWDVNDDIKELIRSRRTVDTARLTDPDIPIGEV